jgi:adenylate cyclase
MSHSGSTSLSRQNIIAVVDDDRTVNTALTALLKSKGHEVISFETGDNFLTWFHHQRQPRCDLIISDINMPGSTGYELCRDVRQSEVGQDRVPIILVTGSEPSFEEAAGIEAGADDFIPKPVQARALFAKIESLLAIRATACNKSEQVDRLTHFLSPSVARMLKSDGASLRHLLKPHRADVSVLFIDLRRFTAFAERAEPEEVLEVLERYYTAVGNAALQFGGTLGHLAGDGIMVFFNDPEPVEKHPEVAVRAALAMREALAPEKVEWADKSYDIDFGIGLAHGFATIGGIGFASYWQYTVIGPVTNLAARLCQFADRGQILVSKRFLGRTDPDLFEAKYLGPVELKGIEKSVTAFDVVSLRAAAVPPRK